MILFVILFFLLIALFVTLIFSAIKGQSKSTTSKLVVANVSNTIAQKADLNKWRGSVRYPAGYYKSEEDFYSIEKKLRYSSEG